MLIEDATSALVDPSAYADGRLERACDLLRRESPVHPVDRPGFRPFFALLKYEDIHSVERQGDLFHAGPRYKLLRAENEGRLDARSLVSMDPPEHTEYRGLVSDWFHPRSIRALESRVRELARAAVDRMTGRGDEPYDFVTEISMHYPLTVICSMLGIPESDRNLILRITQENFGSEDPEFQRTVAVDDNAEFASAFGGYFHQVVQDRLSHPTDDLTSMLAHATLHGEPLAPRDLMGYLGILATAGHDTTSSAIAGGLQALIEHPDQLERLRSDIAIAPNAAEEMIRWVTPVKSFMRTAMADTEIRGQAIAEGESVLLLYASANRDEEAFEHPDRFDVGRDPNRHLAFGHGSHFCLGAHLARLEIRAFFSELIPRLRSIDLTGEPQLIKTIFVGGLKHLPIRAEVA
jgi:cytochrome P450